MDMREFHYFRMYGFTLKAMNVESMTKDEFDPVQGGISLPLQPLFSTYSTDL